MRDYSTRYDEPKPISNARKAFDIALTIVLSVLWLLVMWAMTVMIFAM